MKFIKDYARIAHPLYEVKEEQHFRFGSVQQVSHSIDWRTHYQKFFIYDQFAIIELHTSKQSYGVILLQRKVNEEDLHLVHYMSYKTTVAEQKWCSYEIEILRIIKAVKKFCSYLLGIKFKIVTDCQAFQKTLSKKNLPPKIARWAFILKDFKYEIEHCAGDRVKHIK